jgi:hypothetical protein
MGILINKADERVKDVKNENDLLTVSLMDGIIISVPLAWYARLYNASKEKLLHWEIAGGGYGIYWPEIDEDISTEGLLRGAPSPGVVSKSA